MRELEAEKKNASFTRKKLEDDLQSWKVEKEKDLEVALAKLREEDEARREVEEVNLKLQQELSGMG